MLVQGNQGVTIKDLNSFTLQNTQGSSDGLAAWNGQTITISDVGTVNLGTAENRFIKGGQTIHAAQGYVKISADDLNIYTAGQGIMAQRNGDSTNRNDPSVQIDVTNNVVIDSTGTAVMAGSINSNKGNAGVSIHAGNTVAIRAGANASAAVFSYDKSGQWGGDGPTTISIKGDNGVAIQSDAYGVVAQRTNAGADSSVDIESKNGDVTIHSSNMAVLMQYKLETEQEDTPYITGVITGNNVSLTSDTNTAVYANGSALTLASNTDNGTVTLTGGNGTAAVVTGSKGSLTLGDGSHSTTVTANGIISVNEGTVSVSGNTTVNAENGIAVSNGGLISVDGGTLAVADNAAVSLDAKNLNSEGGIRVTNGGQVTVGTDSKLYVANADSGTKLFSTDNSTGSSIGFTNENTVFDNAFLELGTDGTIGTVSAETAAKQLRSFEGRSIALAATEANNDTLTALLRNGDEGWNGAFRIGAMGGAAHTTYTMAGLFTDAVADHDVTKDEDVWARYIHSKESVDGLSGASYDAQYNGITAGVDLYRKADTAAGIALTYADGSISGSNGIAYTKNDAEYLGISLYGRTEKGNTKILGDITYLSGDHDITQRNGSEIVTASPDTEAWSIGVKGYREYAAGKGTLTPYIGARYLRLTTDAYTSNTGLHYGSDDQDLFLLPVGIDYSWSSQQEEWTFRPYVGLGYIWTMGDRDSSQTVTWGTVSDSLVFDTADAGTFLAKAGVAADRGDFTIGVGYAFQQGSTAKNNVWMGNISYHF